MTFSIGQILHRGGMVSFSANGRTAVLGTALLVLLVAPAIADPVSQSLSPDESNAKKRARPIKKLMPRSHRAATARAGASDLAFGLEAVATSAGRDAMRTLTNLTSLSFTPTNAYGPLSPFSGVPPVFYNRDIGYEDYITSVKLLRKECAVFKSLTDGECIGSRRPRYTDITVTFKAKTKPNTKTEPRCLIDTELVSSYFRSYNNAPILDFLKDTISFATKTSVTDLPKDPFNVQICGLSEVKHNFVCPAQSGSDLSQVRRKVAAAKAGKPLSTKADEDYMRLYQVGVTVYGYNVEHYTSGVYMARLLRKDVNAKLEAKYGKRWKCDYEVEVEVNPTNEYPNERTLHYETKIVPATLKPDGYDQPGNFFTDDDGVPHMYGPTIDVFEQDKVVLSISNHGNDDQATHFHGILFKEPYNYNDGPVGTVMGVMEDGTERPPYNYTWIASPAGTTWYHGHFSTALMGGNRGSIVIRKRPCTDPYAGTYSEDIFIAISEAMPWYLDYSGTTPKAVRHVTTAEDKDNFMGTNPNYAYPANPVADPAVLKTITTAAGLEPMSDQPWAGILFNGKGRAIPMDYSSTPGAQTAESWGEAKGEYYKVNVVEGETYRFRLLNSGGQTGYRVWMYSHDVTIISVAGEDVMPIRVPAKAANADFWQNGMELAPAERFDVLIKFDKTPGVYFLRVDSLDGCYKDLAMIVYDGVTVTAADIAKADAVKRNRGGTDAASCNIFKQFSADLNATQVHSIELNGVPPPNSKNRSAAYVIAEGDGGIFTINEKTTPIFLPPLYMQHAMQGMNSRNVSNVMPEGQFLEQFSFEQTEVVDWCIINYSADRHPIHLHANRFWFLATGHGDLNHCLGFKDYDDTRPVPHVDIINTLPPTEEENIADPDNPTIIPSFLKIRAEIRDFGAWPFHCHLEYHLYGGLNVPVVVGWNATWPSPPVNIPNGTYDGY